MILQVLGITGLHLAEISRNIFIIGQPILERWMYCILHHRQHRSRKYMKPNSINLSQQQQQHPVKMQTMRILGLHIHNSTIPSHNSQQKHPGSSYR